MTAPVFYNTAFVLGGGGVLGAHEVGMLRALAEQGIKPDVILGTSIGAVNGAMFAADPTVEGVERLGQLWAESGLVQTSAGTLLRRVSTLARTGTRCLRRAHGPRPRRLPARRLAGSSTRPDIRVSHVARAGRRTSHRPRCPCAVAPWLVAAGRRLGGDAGRGVARVRTVRRRDRGER